MFKNKSELDDFAVALNATCSKTEALARMLGWMPDPLEDMEVRIAKNASYPVERRNWLYLRLSYLENALDELRYTAQKSLIKAAEDMPTIEGIFEHETAIRKIADQFRKMELYRQHLDEEIAKGDASALKIDEWTTKECGEIRYTLKSVDEWVGKNFGICILDSVRHQSETKSLPGRAEIAKILPPYQVGPEAEDRSASENVMSKATENSLYTAFGLMVQVFAGTSLKYYHRKDGRPKVMTIAKCIAAYGKDANFGHELDSQSAANIKTLIDKAITVMHSKLPAKFIHSKLPVKVMHTKLPLKLAHK